MFGRKNGLLRKEITQALLESLTRCKHDWMNKKELIESSIDPSEEVIYQLKLSESRYLFLLKEVRDLHIYIEN
ncbi:YaaL family protein [Sporolactobacillus vineae]|uniref:YaaL family protein n=1 Tax=Sporolactobacillus vineae TaxID=444463 RepID=UPI000289A33A|nr:YaaL family protein [Sporolactobacillus vineae]